jgi:hypothetical protein
MLCCSGCVCCCSIVAAEALKELQGYQTQVRGLICCGQFDCMRAVLQSIVAVTLLSSVSNGCYGSIALTEVQGWTVFSSWMHTVIASVTAAWLRSDAVCMVNRL